MAKCIYARCKRSIPPDAIFCPYCGRKQVREQKPKKHRTREKGTGSVYKLSGNRKRPYYAVLNGKSAGRMYATRQEAEAAGRREGNERHPAQILRTGRERERADFVYSGYT